MTTDEIFAFANESENADTPKQSDLMTWKVLIVDDEPDIHAVTEMALKGFDFAGHVLEFLHAYSAEEARQVLDQHTDIAVILLDVVMETDHAGLDLAKHIREHCGNNLSRIILRTGNPGQAPELSVVRNYDINDYKEKSELTSQKLYTVTLSAIRAYRDMLALERNKAGLEAVVDATADIFERLSVHQFAKGVLEQLTALLHGNQDAALFQTNGLSALFDTDGSLRILAATGVFQAQTENGKHKALPDDVLSDINLGRTSRGITRSGDRLIASFPSRSGAVNILYMTGVNELSDLDTRLISLFSRNVGIAFENLRLHEDLEETQREIVYMLGEAVETRSRETGNHVKRVAEISKLLARKIGLSSEEAEIVKFASPLHDVGKIGIPDAILNKPGRHTTDEFEIMKTHAELGHDMLRHSRKKILKAGAIIAYEHHEKWDGSGYPNGKTGQDIHIYGRITAVADVFDALGSERCYKKAWPVGKVIDYIKEQSGCQFDPDIVDALEQSMDEVLQIRNAYTDVPIPGAAA